MLIVLFLLATIAPAPTDADLAHDAYRGVTEGNWFLAAGAALALAVRVARPRLEKRWPALAKQEWELAVTAGLAGVAGLAHSWVAGITPDAETAGGAVKVFVSAAAVAMAGRFLWPGGDADKDDQDTDKDDEARS